ncbi:MAG: 3-deoxy-D-manno-octulosonic acid transferase [Rhodocyclaceae bacterium]|nr:3-deoxy-D-manno-octulosonic acid transferase [Rhodocyclaceae bacterium]
MTRFLYTIAIHALLPWAMLHLLWRARRQPEYLRHWGERFGLYRPRPPEPVIWIHAVSVGETRAAQPLVAALRARYPDHRILLTHMTPTGRAASEALFGNKAAGVERVYLPYDTPWAVQRFLRHFKPEIGIIMETELWPNLIAACGRASIPLLLVNARLSEKSARRYARFPNLSRTALRQLSAISASGADDAQRLRELISPRKPRCARFSPQGAKQHLGRPGVLLEGAPEVAVFGNMKFDIEPPIEQLETGREFHNHIGTRPVFLCASTREGEEALILDAWTAIIGAGGTASKEASGGTAPLLVIVPRHPQRFEAVARLIDARGLKMQRRSDNAPVTTDTQVWLGDSMGELFAYYAAADVAFVGGSLLNFGSQNLIEPCAVGVPVLIGPSTFNFAEAAQNALAAGAARQCEDAAALVSQALALLDGPAERMEMGKAGRAFAAQHRGATRRTLALMEKFMPPPGRP